MSFRIIEFRRGRFSSSQGTCTFHPEGSQKKTHGIVGSYAAVVVVSISPFSKFFFLSFSHCSGVMAASISSKNEKRTSAFDDIFKHVSPFGKYQQVLYFTSYLLAFPLISQFFLLVFGFGTPGFHCVTPNVTCDPKKCCDDCTSYEFDGPFHSIVSEVRALLMKILKK